MQTTSTSNARRIALAFAALLFILLYGRYLVGFAPSGGDLVNQYLPYQQLVRDALRQGCLPYWNSATFCGRPLMADIQVGVLYPPNWLHWFLPLPLSFALVLALHGLWMIAGCWRLGRDWNLHPAAIALGTVLFCASPFFTFKSSQGIVLFIYAGAWWPWLALAAMRLVRQPCFGRLAILSIILALSLLAGSPQITYYGWLAAIALALATSAERGVRSAEKEMGSEDSQSLLRAPHSALISLVWLAGAFALAFGLTAIQTMQMASFIGSSFERGSAGGAGWDYIVDGSLKPSLFWLLVNPGFLGNGHANRDIITEVWKYFGGVLDASGRQLDFAESCYYAPLWVAALLLPLGLVTWRWRNAECGMRNAESKGHSSFIIHHSSLMLVGLVAMVLGVLLAPGQYSPVFRLFYYVFPGFNRFRVPARLMLFFISGEALVATLTFDALIRNTSRRIGARVLAISGLLAGLAMIWVPYALRIGLWSEIGRAIPGFFLQRGRVVDSTHFLQASDHALNMGLMATAGLILAFAVVWILTGSAWHGRLARDSESRAGRPCHPIAWLLPALALAELVFLAWPFQKTTPVSQYMQKFYPETELVKALQHEHVPTGGRILWLDDVISWLVDQNQEEIYPNRMVMHSLPDARGYDPVNARWIGQWMNLLAGSDPEKNPHGFMFVPRIARPAWLTLMGVAAVVSYNDLSSIPGLKAVWQRDFPDENKQMRTLTIWRNERFGTAFIMPGAVKIAQSDEQALMDSAALAANPATSPTQAVVVSPTSLVQGNAEKNTDRFSVKPLAQDANHYRYAVNFSAPALLCLAQSAYGGWSVSIDNEPGQIGTYSGTFLAAAIPPGPHIVVFDYLPEGLALGRMISLLALVILLYGAVRSRLRNSRNTQ